MAAGLGYKEFTTGDVLTAADANGYLASQVVMVFAGAAARTSAITSPQEGMISYLKDTNSTEYYSGSAWVAIAGGGSTGKVAQVLSTLKTDTFSTTSTTDVTVTGLSQAITPSSATSKVLITVSLAAGVSNVNSDLVCFGLSGGNTATYRGDTAGTRQRTVHWIRRDGTDIAAQTNMPMTMVYLDSPATTSATTYNVIARCVNGTGHVNRSGTDTNNGEWARSASTITVMEILA
jgi:hypothetical protein